MSSLSPSPHDLTSTVNPLTKTISDTQAQTRDTFGFKWQLRETFESDAVQSHSRKWLIQRYCEGEADRLSRWLAGGRKRILDAGCGAGHSALAFFGDHLLAHEYIGVDVSGDAIAVARDRFRDRGYEGQFLEGSLSDVPIADASMDMILAEGVLHHTDDTRASFLHLARKLKPGGLFLSYVYAKKAVLREYADDHVRDRLRGLTDEEAWAALMPLTKLGAALGEKGVTIDVPEDIPLLGIKKGTYDLQRFFHWNVCKLFHRKDFTLDEMNHVNFDWYRPMNCHRHTPEDVVAWCAGAELELERLVVEEAGISAVARRSTNRAHTEPRDDRPVR